MLSFSKEKRKNHTLQTIAKKSHMDHSKIAKKSGSFTVILAVKANGEKLPPKVIFKGVRQLRIEVPRRMQVSVHKKAWMDEEGLFFHLYNFRSI